MSNEQEIVTSLLKEKRNIDISAYHPSFLEKQIQSHRVMLGDVSLTEYLQMLSDNTKIVECLMDLLAVHVSSFFRNPLTFEIIYQLLLPRIIDQKKGEKYASIRLWSAGCSFGEEAYSLAILVCEALAGGNIELQTELFSTDIDPKALEISEEAFYENESLDNVRFGWLKKYFSSHNKGYKVLPEIRNLVKFSPFNLVDKKHHAPVESVFGTFDLICCRNVLIYYRKEYQSIIVSKLVKSLAPGGYLVLGDSETLPTEYLKDLTRMFDFEKIYQKSR